MILTALLLMQAAAQAPQRAVDCTDAITQTDMNICAAREYEAADDTMNTQWKKTLASMQKRDDANTSRSGGFGYVAALRASQRAWLTFRDRQCVLEGGRYAGGSMQPLERATCLAKLTRARTAQLKNLIWEN
ncbi:lysozyme inhibitor LprI family protein [Qipengyuania spongiae]|uniref:Lysozyme inhibitor LprI family protein n=1 Tax=Qipengyuania spongiae TaxID=2909673 RepID=A0ABY5T0W0_9SPHN|nr:lysozyme inhibitor LprI family protein [Qipengyuania spongiae]UVI39144.1 lysozyme inhibitor LprI family protein [Qipengyuania spongiae]